MMAQLGGKVEPSTKREFGRATIEVTGQSPLFEGVWALGATDDVWIAMATRSPRSPKASASSRARNPRPSPSSPTRHANSTA